MKTEPADQASVGAGLMSAGLMSAGLMSAGLMNAGPVSAGRVRVAGDVVVPIAGVA